MFMENQKVKVILTDDKLEVYELMGECKPWFHGKVARVTGLVYEEKSFYGNAIDRYWGVQFYGKSGHIQVVSEKEMFKL